MEIKTLKEVYDYLQSINNNSKLSSLVLIQEPVSIKTIEIESTGYDSITTIIKRVEVNNDHETILSVPYESCKITEAEGFIILTTINCHRDTMLKNYIFESAIILSNET